MSAVKSGLIGAAAVGGVIAVLFASGTVKLSGSQNDDVADEADGEDGKSKKGGKKGKRRRKKGRRGKGQDLRSLGYLAESRPEAHQHKEGLTIHDKARVSAGYVIYNYCGWGAGLENEGRDKPWGDTVLLSLEGKELHRWHTTLFGDKGGGVSISKLLPNGDLVINRADLGVARIDFDSNTVWQLEGVYHHDLAIEEDESVWVMAERKLPMEGTRRGNILDHGVTHISKDGEVLETLWFSDTLAQESHYKDSLGRKKAGKGRGDVLHGNAVEILQDDGPDGLWKKGDILSSVRNLNMIIVVQRETGKLLWSWGAGELQHQHAPVAAPDGKFLVFDNGHRRKASRVLEVDPATKQIVWKYEGTPSNPFYSGTRGTLQPLEGGNVFVGSSNDGRMFQVARDGEVVWEYWTKDKAKGKVVPIRAGHVDGSLKEAIDLRLSGKAPVAADDGSLDDAEPDEGQPTEGQSADGDTDAADDPEDKANDEAQDKSPVKVEGKAKAKAEPKAKDEAPAKPEAKAEAKPEPAEAAE